MKLQSVKFKISVLYTVILGLILLVYSVMLYFSLSYLVYREIDRNLQKKASEIDATIQTYSEMFKTEKESDSLSLQRALHLDEFESREFFQWPSVKRTDQFWQYKVQALGIKLDYIVVYYPTGEVVEKSDNVEDYVLKNLKNCFRGVAKNRKNKTVIRNCFLKELRLRVITRPFYQWNRVKYIIQLATPIEPQLFILRNKWKLILITIPVFLFLASFIGRFLVIKIFEPITEIAETAKAISYKDMSKRVELAHADEELKSLVDGFNDMIARLEKSFQYIEEFSFNVAHELKTPLAILRGELEVALRKDRAPEDYKKAIVIALDEAQRMLKTINDLLLLAKLDYQTEVFKFERLDLAGFLKEIYEQSEKLASERNIAVSLDLPSKPLPVDADRLHLRRLFVNLIDNAIKFTPKGGKIGISAQSRNHFVHVAISDTGVGIAEGDLPKIFDRFFHVDRTDEAPSVNGLGLSIVQSIARIHRGTVDVASQLGKGTTFTVKLPLA